MRVTTHTVLGANPQSVAPVWSAATGGAGATGECTIRTTEGVGFLVIDGPPSAWHRLDDDIGLIRQVIELTTAGPSQ